MIFSKTNWENKFSRFFSKKIEKNIFSRFFSKKIVLIRLKNERKADMRRVFSSDPPRVDKGCISKNAENAVFTISLHTPVLIQTKTSHMKCAHLVTTVWRNELTPFWKDIFLKKFPKNYKPFFRSSRVHKKWYIFFWCHVVVLDRPPSDVYITNRFPLLKSICCARDDRGRFHRNRSNPHRDDRPNRKTLMGFDRPGADFSEIVPDRPST